MHPILAKFHEAKEAGFEWADDAIAAFDEMFASETDFENLHEELTYSKALGDGFMWTSGTRGIWAWAKIYNELNGQGL